MDRSRAKQVMAISIIVVLVINIILLALDQINPILFWIILGAAYLIPKMVLPNL